MEIIKKYRAIDGVEFDDINDCLEHDKETYFKVEVDNALKTLTHYCQYKRSKKTCTSCLFKDGAECLIAKALANHSKEE